MRRAFWLFQSSFLWVEIAHDLSYSVRFLALAIFHSSIDFRTIIIFAICILLRWGDVNATLP
jgi:hypothetical protein